VKKEQVGRSPKAVVAVASVLVAASMVFSILFAAQSDALNSVHARSAALVGHGDSSTTSTTSTTTTSTTTTMPSASNSTSALIAAGPSRNECLTPDFTDTGLASLQAAVTSFNNLTNSTVTCLSAYLGSAKGWSDWESPWITDPSVGYTTWVAEAPLSRQLILAVQLIPNNLADVNDPLKWERSCAAGGFNAHARRLGANLVAAGLENSVIRLGSEMNGVWETDFIGTTKVEQNLWAKCFSKEVLSLRSVPGEHFLIDWNVNACTGSYAYPNYYPGNAYVDIVGLDLYDVDCHTPFTKLSFSKLASELLGLDHFEAFAAAKGKPMSLPEWGLATIPAGDDPAYIDGIGSTVENRDFAFQTYFDGGGGPNSKALALSPRTPLALAAYQKFFGDESN
jgi:hypothetical protein